MAVVLIVKGTWVSSGGSANYGVLWQMPIQLHIAGHHATFMESVSDSLVRNMCTSRLIWVTLLSCLSPPPPVHSSTKEQIQVLLLGFCPSMALFNSPGVTASLSRDCVKRHCKPSCNCTYSCAFLE